MIKACDQTGPSYGHPSLYTILALVLNQLNAQSDLLRLQNAHIAPYNTVHTSTYLYHRLATRWCIRSRRFATLVGTQGPNPCYEQLLCALCSCYVYELATQGCPLSPITPCLRPIQIRNLDVRYDLSYTINL